MIGFSYIKIFKKLSILAVLLFAVFLGFAFFAFGQGKNLICGESDYPDEKNYPIHSSYIVGESMEPTFKNGQIFSYDTSAKPKIGDIVSFQCFTDNCVNGDPDARIKRLIKINEQGCYWFEGDNKFFSEDSRNYGYLCPPDDVKILGVVVK